MTKLPLKKIAVASFSLAFIGVTLLSAISPFAGKSAALGSCSKQNSDGYCFVSSTSSDNYVYTDSQTIVDNTTTVSTYEKGGKTESSTSIDISETFVKNGSSNNFVANTTDACGGDTVAVSGPGSGSATFTSKLTTKSGSGRTAKSTCSNTKKSINIGQTDRAGNAPTPPAPGAGGASTTTSGFDWTDANTIVVTGTDAGTYVNTEKNGVIAWPLIKQGTTNACPDEIQLDPNDNTQGTLITGRMLAGRVAMCSGGVGAPITGIKDADKGATSTGTPATPGAAATSAPTCESTDGTGLGWIMCKVFNGVGDLSDFFFSSIVQPFLKTSPISTDANDPTYKVWSSFRVYGDIFLIIALMVIVISQIVGGGLVDAYTVKKALPRVLIGVILINLSIYIVAFAVDVSNILGQGIGQLMTAPLGNNGQFHITISGISVGKLGAGGLTLAMTTIVLGLFKATVIKSAVGWLLLFVGMPVLFALITAYVTLIIRRGLILVLIMVSPVAFALYCLPNTEKYFRRWWDLLLRTLIVYPIIVIFFAVADLLSVTISSANGPNNATAALIAFTLQFLPLFGIAYAFRLAGGLLGRAHEVLTTSHKRAQEGIKGSEHDPLSLRNRARNNLRNSTSRARASSYRSSAAAGGIRGRVGARLNSGALEREAQLNEAAKKRIFSVKDNGDDAIVNAATSFVDPDGVRRTLNAVSYTDENGVQKYKGGEVKDADWRASQIQYPNLSDKLAVADYRSTKILTPQEARDFSTNFGMMAKQNGLSLSEANSTFTATSFARQNERGEYKHGQFVEEDGNFVFKRAGEDAPQEKTDNFVNEQYYKRGSFEGSRMHSTFFDSLASSKAGYLKTAETLGAKGVRTDKEQKEYDNSRLRLKQILETEKAFDVGTDTVPGENNNEPSPRSPFAREGLQGASAASQAAFLRLKRTGQTPSGENTGVLKDLHAEIDRGDTADTYQGARAPSEPFEPKQNGGPGQGQGPRGGGQPRPPQPPPSGGPGGPSNGSNGLSDDGYL